MAKEQPVTVAGLREAVLLSARANFPIRVVVTEIELRHAPALETLFARATREEPGWIIIRNLKIGHLARLSNVIDLVLYAVLPILEEKPKDTEASRLLRQHGWSISHLSRKVDGDGGPFHGVADPVGALLRRHATHLYRRTRDVVWLSDNLDTLRERLEELKSVVVLMPYPGGDDDDDGPQGAEEEEEEGEEEAKE